MNLNQKLQLTIPYLKFVGLIYGMKAGGLMIYVRIHLHIRNLCNSETFLVTILDLSSVYKIYLLNPRCSVTRIAESSLFARPSITLG